MMGFKSDKKIPIAKDKNGREYALVSKVKEGEFLIPDNSFTCMKEGERLEVKARPITKELYISCKNVGGHDIIGQYETKYNLETCEPFYIGLYLAESE